MQERNVYYGILVMTIGLQYDSVLPRGAWMQLCGVALINAADILRAYPLDF